MMIQSKRAPAPTHATPPGGELRFHRTNRKVSEGALGDHPQDVVIALELSLSLFVKTVQTPGVGSGWGAPSPFSPRFGQPGFAPSLKTTPGQPERGWLQREEVLSWLKIFQIASNKQTAEKSHWFKNKTKQNSEGLILGLRGELIQSLATSCPRLGVPPH